MRIAILTALRNSTASLCLPALLDHRRVHVSRVILVRKVESSRIKKVRRKARKIRKIGLLGALNGIRIRPWFDFRELEDIEKLCQRFQVPFYQSETTNGAATSQLLKEAKVDLGVSLGNGYISPKIFSVPRFGMINLHGELLPQFPGAQSVIWSIHEQASETGFTIHQISAQIDQGTILHRESWPIEYAPQLRQTVARNLSILQSRLPSTLAEVCANYEQITGETQEERVTSLTTPSLHQFLRMNRLNKQQYQSKSKTKDPRKQNQSTTEP